MRAMLRLSVGVGVVVGLSAGMAAFGSGGAGAPAEPKFIGAAKCANCHQGEAKGAMFEKWKESSHSRAFETLGTDKAKEVAAAKGIEDPQKSEACLRCHVTAFGQPAERLQRGFDGTKEGVGCESCHGPGEAHFKARFLEAAKAAGGWQETPEGEIESPALETCVRCHNEESPTFKPFCFKERWAVMGHLDPRHPRSEEKLKQLECTCEKPCPCQKGECGDPFADE